jgi:hypothetical protein
MDPHLHSLESVALDPRLDFVERITVVTVSAGPLSIWQQYRESFDSAELD